jgi:hypothetical protein
MHAHPRTHAHTHTHTYTQVFCRFFTGVNGEKYPPVKSPAQRELKNRAGWKKVELARIAARKHNKIIEKKYNKARKVYEVVLSKAYMHHRRAAALEHAAPYKPAAPVYEEVSDVKYVSVPQDPTVLALERDTVRCWLPNIGYRDFNVQGVYDSSFSQKQVYDRVASRISQNAIYGYNGTLFVYGQTGSGKTWSMFGESLFQTMPNGERKALPQPNPANYGFVPRACQHILESVESDAGCTSWSFDVAYTEFYQVCVCVECEVYDAMCA